MPRISVVFISGRRSIFARDDTSFTMRDIFAVGFVLKLQIPTPRTSSIPLIFCGQEAFKTPFEHSTSVLSSDMRTALWLRIRRNVKSDFPLPDGPVISIPLFFRQTALACIFLFINLF